MTAMTGPKLVPYTEKLKLTKQTVDGAVEIEEYVPEVLGKYESVSELAYSELGKEAIDLAIHRIRQQLHNAVVKAGPIAMTQLRIGITVQGALEIYGGEESTKLPVTPLPDAPTDGGAA